MLKSGYQLQKIIAVILDIKQIMVWWLPCLFYLYLTVHLKLVLRYQILYSCPAKLVLSKNRAENVGDSVFYILQFMYYRQSYAQKVNCFLHLLKKMCVGEQAGNRLDMQRCFLTHKNNLCIFHFVLKCSLYSYTCKTCRDFPYPFFICK